MMNSAGERSSEARLIGHIDGIRQRRLVGWLARRTGGTAFEEGIPFRVVVDGLVVATDCVANIHRRDVAAAGFGSGRSGFAVSLPSHFLDGATHAVEILTDGGDSLSAAVEFPTPLTASQREFFVEEASSRQITGWLIEPGQQRAVVEMVADGEVIAQAYATISRPDVATAKGVRDCGFVLVSPLRARSTAVTELALRVRGDQTPLKRITTPPLHTPKVVFVANAENEADGSRIYRAQLASKQLTASGIESSVVPEKQAFETVGAEGWPPKSSDVIVFQRVPGHPTAKKALNLARARGILCLYDVDDLMFKSWRREEMGVIRSGKIKLSDKGHVDSVESRLNLMMECDGVICSTSYLQREVRNLGLPAILSRNAVEDAVFSVGAARLANGRADDDRCRILFMSGSETHDADFATVEHVLHEILVENPNARLTLLGNLRATRLDLLPNVRRKALVPRETMFSVIANHDVVLAPLERSGFNTAKSSLKFIESASVGVPVVASPLYEFKRDIGNSDGGIIAHDGRQWKSAIEMFIRAPGRTFEYGERAFKYAIRNYSLSSRDGFLWSEICRLDAHVRRRRFEVRSAGYAALDRYFR